MNDAQTTIGFLRNELNATTAKVQRQEEIMGDVAGFGNEMQTARQEMED